MGWVPRSGRERPARCGTARRGRSRATRRRIFRILPDRSGRQPFYKQRADGSRIDGAEACDGRDGADGKGDRSPDGPRPTAHGPRPTAHGPRPTAHGEYDPHSVVAFVAEWAVRSLRLGADDAQDLAQDTWTRLIRSRRSPGPSTEWRGFAICIAANAHPDRRRAADCRRRHEALAVRPESDAGVGDPLQLLETEDLEQRVRHAVGALDDSDRSLLQRWIWDGVSIRDLALECSLAKSVLHDRLRAICARLKAVLGDLGRTEESSFCGAVRR
ncbi:MAG: sigma-70 family RNA polymerase sigma factor [Candidatus Brocadiae bacterium]|nr:sigma-70 family RNA polymerase sigma factor [Candidatus Brocadiia bacterium]